MMLVKIIIETTVWSIEQERNKRIFVHKFFDKYKLKKLAEKLIRMRAFPRM